MSRKKRQRDDDFERLLCDAARDLGWLLPETDDEIAAIERDLDEDAELPEKLKDASCVLRGGLSRAEHPVDSFSRHPKIEESLGRAARNGGEIDPEVLARMHQDRRDAEDQRDGSQG